MIFVTKICCASLKVFPDNYRYGGERSTRPKLFCYKKAPGTSGPLR